MSSSCIPNYFSIDDILTTQERASCKFIVNVPKLGKLNPASEDKDVKAGTTLELPLWLITQLSLGRQPVISVDLPRVYKDTHREILEANACAVDLHKFGPHFYEVGAYIKKFDNRHDVANVLLHTFQSRFKLIKDLADNSEDDPKIEDRLDSTERKLFHDGRTARAQLNAWLVQTTTPIETATMVVNHKKRKRIDIEHI